MRIKPTSCGLFGTVGVLAFLIPAPAQEPPRYTRWENYTLSNGMPDDKVLSVAVDGDRVWAGTRNGLVLIEGGRIKKVFKPENGLAGRVVTAIAVDRNTGSLWIATFGGLSRYSGGQFLNYTSLASGLANDIVYDVAVQGPYVWAATAAGVSRLDTRTGEWSIFSENSAPLLAPQAVAIADGGGRMYFGIWGGGVVEYDEVSKRWLNLGGNIHQSPTGKQRRLDRFVSAVAYHSETTTLWAATHSGINAFDGLQWRNYTTASSGAPPSVTNTIRRRANGLWMCTDQGLTLFADKTGTWITYRRGKGGTGVITTRSYGKSLTEETIQTSLAHNEVLNLAFQKTDIWVATAGGLSHGMVGDLASGAGRVAGRPPVPGHGRSASEQEADLLQSATVNIGFFGPLENSAESAYGLSMLRGAQLAIEQANATGGYRSGGEEARPYVLKVHNDSAQWGASTMELVKMRFDEQVAAALGPIDGESAQVMLRATEALEIPTVVTGATDSSVRETRVRWLVRILPDDRQQAAALAEYAFKQMKLRRVGVVRARTRAAQVGARAFFLEAQRIGNAPVLEVELGAEAEEFSAQLQALRDARIDGLAIWAEPTEAADLLKQMRALGMPQSVFGPSRLASPLLVAHAGPAADGLVAVCALDPTREDPRWLEFERKYRLRFDEVPDAFASYSYDGTMLLISAIQRAGLSRTGIMEELRNLRYKAHDGVSGNVRFDGGLNNVAPITMTRVEGGRFKYWKPERDSAAQ